MKLYRNRKKTLKLFFSFAGLFLVLLLAFLYSIGLFDSVISVKLAAATSVLGLIVAIVLLKILFSLKDTSPLIELNKDGIKARVTALSKAAGLIYWKDVLDMVIEKRHGDMLVVVSVARSDYYIPLIRKRLSAFMIDGIQDERGNLQICLTASELDMDVETLFLSMNSFRKAIGS